MAVGTWVLVGCAVMTNDDASEACVGDTGAGSDEEQAARMLMALTKRNKIASLAVLVMVFFASSR